VALESKKHAFFELINQNGHNKKMIGMATEKCTMVRVIFWEMLGLSNDDRGRCGSVVQGKKRKFVVGRPKTRVNNRFVYFAKIAFGIRNFQ
jgi:hypothetical protein